MSIYNIPDYRAKYFEHKDLDKIYGQPTIDTILTLLKQGKRNGLSVQTTLGGGQLGYLWLFLKDADYNAIPGATRFIRPVDPGVFSPIPNPGGAATRGGSGPLPLTAADIATQKLAHDELKRQYNECQAVEVALRKQIIEAIDGEYLQSLRNPITDTITSSILDIFEFLKKSYGRLSPGQLKEKETILDNMVYDPATNVDTVFNKIQEFNELCTLLDNGKTDTQQVTYAYLIFQKTGIFMDGLKMWNSKPNNTKTFSNFRLHMRQEYLDLQDVGGLTINNSINNQANLIQELKDHQVLMTNNMKEEFNTNMMQTFQALNLLEANADNIEVQSNKENENTNFDQENSMFAIKGQRDPAIDQIMKQMTFMQNTMQTFMDNSSNGKGNKNGKGKGSPTSLINPKTGQPWKRYCWSCGCCPHWGKNCSSKKPGHKDEASFRNRMEGSSENCL